MNDLTHLANAVREHLSDEDRRLLRTIYFPATPERYDDVFDRVLERVKSENGLELGGRSRNP